LLVLLFTLAVCVRSAPGEVTNTVIPRVLSSPQAMYNAGTRMLAAGKFTDAERLFSAALAVQNQNVQSVAVYNLGHARFGDGGAVLKKARPSQAIFDQADTALAAGSQAINQAQSALAEGDFLKIFNAYLEGRGVRKGLRAAEEAIRTAMKIYGQTLQQWQLAAGDFRSAAELNPADTNATWNAELVDREIARLVDRMQRMQQMAGQLAGQHSELNGLMSQMRGRMPGENAPPGIAGDDEDENLQPDSLRGQAEGESRSGGKIESSLSPEEAGQLLEALSLDGGRRLPMNGTETGQPRERSRRNW